MPFRVICTSPECLRLREFNPADAGQRIACDHCGTEMHLPNGNRLQGLVLDDFALISELGVGAMARVYKGLDLVKDRHVAVKVFYPELAADTVMLRRFEREAHLALELKHPNIVAGYAAGQAHDQTYIAMEYMDGESTRERLKRKGRLSPDDAIAIVASAAEALAYARRFGIVHRDVKPANILTNSRGEVKLADMGMVRLEDSKTLLTCSDYTTGTPLYMAPEHARDPSTADLRSDIYSLGISLLFMLTGKHPFKRSSLFKVLQAHEEDPLPCGVDLGVELPPELDDLAQKMAAKNPDDRFQNYASLSAALRAVHAAL